MHNLFLVYLFLLYLYQSLHVSGDYVPIIRRNICVYATLGTCYSVWMTVWYSNLHNRQSFTLNNKYQVSHKHRCFSWWWTHSRPKHVETDINIPKINCAPSWLYLQDYTGMHGQQNIKKIHPITSHKGTEMEYRCSSTLSLISALSWGPDRLTPGTHWTRR